MLTVDDFIVQNHVSCNGCFFQLEHRVTCMDDKQRDLIDRLFFKFGKCSEGCLTKIFRLKADEKTSIKKTRAKPKENFSFVEEIPYHQKSHTFQETDTARY